MNGRIKSIDGGRSRAENPRLRKIPLQDVMGYRLRGQALGGNRL